MGSPHVWKDEQFWVYVDRLLKELREFAKKGTTSTKEWEDNVKDFFTESLQVDMATYTEPGRLTLQSTQEVEELGRECHGLQFKTTSATAEQLEGAFMQQLATKMSSVATNLWAIISSIMESPQNRRKAREPATPMNRTPPTLADGDSFMGELGGDEDEKGDQETPKKRWRRAATRNTALGMIKTVVCISIMLHNSNERCNYLQAILGLFCHSTGVPEKVVEVLAHAGSSVSLTSIHHAVSSISKEISVKISVKIKKEVWSMCSAFAYDNFDMDFKTAQPTIEHSSRFVSATSATVIPLFGVSDPAALRCSAELWQRDSRNPAATSPFKEIRSMLQYHKEDTYNKQLHPDKLSPRSEAFAWHVRSILVNQCTSFGHFSSLLGEPDIIDKIPVHKMNQIPCRAMNIKQSTPDGNIEVLDNLLRQGGIGDKSDKHFVPELDADMSEYVILVHGDLLTKERIDLVKDTRRIEGTP
ncbi:hypothetical protein SERLADRAFT_440219 [Serpula lacrymans var. lacrymans S7.9]|uniref:DUF6589 domain-containing protein n=1 Tax=Serpula lacrymans var. lacrymans (strain S7.9) TaxID=578457 RepID=F8P3V5_SERL9|nr:uncharacterized protein SERLADRAFT_440219 [Serpula lacrymans var. lacrymans S7.9]EGO22204.1 hypothetical protein SERLADRAFT_440219 [Serpula lacrymans var. lacrymans S7.9]